MSKTTTTTPTAIDRNGVSRMMVNHFTDPPEAGPATNERVRERATARPVPCVRTVRRALGLTQEKFVARYGIPLGTLGDREQDRTEPDRPARPDIRVIAGNPEWVSRALAGEP